MRSGRSSAFEFKRKCSSFLSCDHHIPSAIAARQTGRRLQQFSIKYEYFLASRLASPDSSFVTGKVLNRCHSCISGIREVSAVAAIENSIWEANNYHLIAIAAVIDGLLEK